MVAHSPKCLRSRGHVARGLLAIGLLVVVASLGVFNEWRRAGAEGSGAAAAAHLASATPGAEARARPAARVLHDKPPARDHAATQKQWRRHWRQAERQRLAGAPERQLNVPSSWALAEEEATWRVQPRYSTFTCIGPKPDDRWQAASCKFENVCLNSATDEFEFYQNTDLYPSMPMGYEQLQAQPWQEFPEKLVSPVQWQVDKTLGWRPRLVRRPFPTVDGEQVVWAPSPQALLQSFPQRFLVNFGHAMYDLAVPLFNLQHLWGVYRPDAQVLLLNKTSADSWAGIDYYARRMVITPDPQRSVFRLTWDRDATWTANYTREVLGGDREGLVCFKSLLVGTGNLTRRGRATDALPYRDAVAQRLELREPAFGREAQPVITLLDKEGRRVIENLDEVAAVLRRRYPTARVQIVSFGKHPDLTMAEQVQLMSETSILISPCGGLATVLTFMRPGATALVMNFWHTHLNRSVMMEDQFYTNLEYLDLQYFPVNLEDYEGTSDRPECELVPGGTRRHDSRYDQSGALVNCNLWLGKQGMARMQNYVDQAMLRWAARYGRFDVLEPLRQQRAAELQAQGLPLPPAHLEAAAEVARAAATAVPARGADAQAEAEEEESQQAASLASFVAGQAVAGKGQAATTLAAPREVAQPEQGQVGQRRRGHKVQRRGKALIGGGQGPSGSEAAEEQ